MKDHDETDIRKAFERALEESPLPLGVFYVEKRPTFESQQRIYKNSLEPLFKRKHSVEQIMNLIESKRRW